MIQFKVKKLKSPKTGTLFYFPIIVQSGTLTLSEVASRIAKRSTMHTADIKAVLSALEQTVGDALTSGHSVRLGDLGSFRPTINAAKSREHLEDVTADDIKAVRVRFTPAPALTRRLLPGNVQLKIKS